MKQKFGGHKVKEKHKAGIVINTMADKTGHELLST
jgi:hypothetical protein